MTAGFIQSNSALNISRFTPRQGEVLDAALGLLVKVGDKLTMNEVAKAASCSKETLYNWFGDREGLLISIVQWQASKVVMPEVDFSRIDRVGVIRGLEIFGANLLQVLTSDTSVALNRVAIARAVSSNLGSIVLENGRFAMGKRLKPLLEAGRDAQLLSFDTSEAAYRCFFGLLVQDTQLRMLLGEGINMSAEQIKAHAAWASNQFMKLYST